MWYFRAALGPSWGVALAIIKNQASLLLVIYCRTDALFFQISEQHKINYYRSLIDPVIVSEMIVRKNSLRLNESSPSFERMIYNITENNRILS